MPTPEELLDAVRALNWATLEPLLVALPADERAKRINWLVHEIRQQGYTMCRRPAAAELTRRDQFRQSLRTFLDNAGFKEVADEWRTEDSTSGAVEWGYHQILASLRGQVHGVLPPDRHVWATLRHLEGEFSTVRQAVLNWKPVDGQVLDPAAIRIELPDGSKVQPDDYVTTLTNAATATLKMLGIANRWFRPANDRLILPAPVPPEPTDANRVANVQGLGVIWQSLERTDEHIRFFGGGARVEEADVTDPTGHTVRAKVLVCDIDGEPIIYDQIAHERNRSRLMQFWHQLNWETTAEQKVSGVVPVALPPAAFVTLEEAHADVAISELLCRAVVEDQEERGGMRIVEWVRAYACLKLFAHLKLEQDNSIGPIPLNRDELRQFLTERGLTLAKAEHFIESIIFSRAEPDLFDAPLFEAAGGQLFLCARVAHEVHPTEVVLSKLATVSANLAWRGPEFEERVRALFLNEGIPARHIDRQVNGETLEVDCVAFWGGTLFVFECKNVSLSGRSNESTYRFYQQQDHAIKQVMRKRDTLLANPSLLEDAFGEPLQISRTVAVVLNALPFSMGELSEGLYMYDFSALSRFFQDRYFKTIMPAKIGDDVRLLRRHGFKSLWSADKPTAEDLIRQMGEPSQLKACLSQYEWVRVVVPLGERAALATSRVRRETRSLEADLTAMGVDGARIAGEIREIHDEFAKRVQQLQGQFDRQSLAEEEKPDA